MPKKKKTRKNLLQVSCCYIIESDSYLFYINKKKNYLNHWKYKILDKIVYEGYINQGGLITVQFDLEFKNCFEYCFDCLFK